MHLPTSSAMLCGMLSLRGKAKREEVRRVRARDGKKTMNRWRAVQVEVALNELAIISEDEWVEMGLLGNMDLVVPFSLKKIRWAQGEIGMLQVTSFTSGTSPTLHRGGSTGGSKVSHEGC